MISLDNIKEGSKVWFDGEKQGYTVQARTNRYLICTKPFNLKRTVIYCIIDTVELIRGAENLVFGLGAETKLDCIEMLLRLEINRTQISRRNRVELKITKIIA